MRCGMSQVPCYPHGLHFSLTFPTRLVKVLLFPLYDALGRVAWVRESEPKSGGKPGRASICHAVRQTTQPAHRTLNRLPQFLIVVEGFWPQGSIVLHRTSWSLYHRVTLSSCNALTTEPTNLGRSILSEITKWTRFSSPHGRACRAFTGAIPVLHVGIHAEGTIYVGDRKFRIEPNCRLRPLVFSFSENKGE